jgi:sphinganine-1-phosphate aldolase
MYNSKSLRKYQYFVSTDWMGGVYGTSTMAGSRPGALSAGCWAAMMHFGVSGYVETTKQIINAARLLKSGILKIPELKLMGDPFLSVVAFSSVGNINTYALADLLSQKDWQLNVLQFPPSIHMAITLPSVKTVESLLNDIKVAISTLKNDPNAGKGDVAAIYGTSASISDRSIIGDVTCGFLDALTKV